MFYLNIFNVFYFYFLNYLKYNYKFLKFEILKLINFIFEIIYYNNNFHILKINKKNENKFNFQHKKFNS